MAKGVNKVILVGNLGQDPEVKYTPNGGAIARIRVATSETWKDKNTGAAQEHTEWHRVVIFGKLAEIVGQYLKKGSQVYLEGSLRTNKWQDQSGQERYTTEIVANEMQMLGGRGGSGGGQSSSSGYGDMDSAPMPSPRGNSSNNSNNSNAGGSTPPPSSTPNFEDFDDDIPF